MNTGSSSSSSNRNHENCNNYRLKVLKTSEGPSNTLTRAIYNNETIVIVQMKDILESIRRALSIFTTAVSFNTLFSKFIVFFR
jgi:hypothetical protein